MKSMVRPFSPYGHSTWAEEIWRERRRRALRICALAGLIVYAVWVTVALTRARHELRVAQGEIRP